MTALPQAGETQHWHWPINPLDYDHTMVFTPEEVEALDTFLAALDAHASRWSTPLKQPLMRLIRPIEDTGQLLGWPKRRLSRAVAVLLRQMQKRGKPLCAWMPQDWQAIIASQERPLPQFRALIIALAYLVYGFLDVATIRKIEYRQLAHYVFGQELVDSATRRIAQVLAGWGYQLDKNNQFPALIALILLINRSPYLEDITAEHLQSLHAHNFRRHHRCLLAATSRALLYLGILPHALNFYPDPEKRQEQRGAYTGVADEWLGWCQRWFETSTLTYVTRRRVRSTLIRVGRWLAQCHPEITHPAQWTREIAAELVAAIDKFHNGDWLWSQAETVPKAAKPMGAKSKLGKLYCVRTFFIDCQRWGWIPYRFDPARCLAAPRSLNALVGTNPRPIADDIWAKLLHAGLNLSLDDLPEAASAFGAEKTYPLGMVRAIAMVWLFAGLRSDEIRRLRIGCVRWQKDDVLLAGTDTVLPKDAVCFLDVPVNKTGTAFTKPVDRFVGMAISEWERERPAQSPLFDAKTNEYVHYLFCYRNRPIGRSYINTTLIPLLCRKAGVPQEDARGNITSHRARSTIASQLFNAKDPMSLFELQAWLGHRSIQTTRHYAAITPTHLAKSYTDANYFARNVRTIDVLIDQQAIVSGDATRGLPWRYVDLGHGYCTYDFFDQCPQRMACAKCSFYRPKSAVIPLLEESRAHYLHMRQDIPLTDLELAAVEEDLAATEKLIAGLRDIPTPAGLTPRQLQTADHEDKPGSMGVDYAPPSEEGRRGEGGVRGAGEGVGA